MRRKPTSEPARRRAPYGKAKADRPSAGVAGRRPGVEHLPQAEFPVKDVPADQPADPAFIPGSKVAGRDVIRTRTVYAGDKVLYQDTFFSHYAPVWGGPPPAPVAAKP